MAPRLRGHANAHEFRILLAATRVRDSYARDPSPANGRALAHAQMILGDYTASVSMLSGLAHASPLDSRTLSDLSAALLVRAERNGRPEDYPAALEAATRALELHRAHPRRSSIARSLSVPST